MRNLACLTAIIFSLFSVSCVKHEAKKKKMRAPVVFQREPYKAPVVVIPEPPKIPRNGLRCDIKGQTEEKEVFVVLSEGKTMINFHDFTSATKITAIVATFEEYKLWYFKLSKASENSGTLVGVGAMTFKDKANPKAEDESLMIIGRVTWHEDNTGKLERAFQRGFGETSEFEEIGVIGNCEEFGASII